TYRILVMGASAAAGTPDGAYSFGRMLKVMLSLQYPETNFEVITAAMPAINSHVVLEIAKDSPRYNPDLFIVYLGNNEVVGPYGAGTVFAPLSANLSLIRFGVALKSTKVGQLVTGLTRLFNRNSPKIWLGMEMFLDKQVRKSSPQMKIVYRNFQKNLEDIFKVAKKIKKPLICCTVGSNLKDNPPFASQHSLNLKDSEKEKWDELYQQGISLETYGEYSSAADIYLQAAKIDSDYADLQFRLGNCYWQMSKYEESKERYVLARELDTLRFRADNQINTIIRDVASDRSKEGIYLVDSSKVIEQNSPNQTPGEELFYEHVHLNFKGNYLLAQTIFKQVDEVLPEKIKNNSLSEAEDAQKSHFPSEQEVARYLAYTDWEVQHIADKVVNEFLKQPPFTNQLYNAERVRHEEQRVKVLKAAITEEAMKEIDQQYRWAILQTPSDAWLYWKYGLMQEDLQNPSGAARQYETVLKYEPTHYLACAKLALCFGQMGNLEAAIEYNLRAIKMYPTSADAYFNLGFAYHLKQMYDKAIANYKKALKMNPEHSKAYNNLGFLLYESGKVKEALSTYRTGIQYVPNNLDLHYNLGIMLNDQGQKEEAIKEFREALKIDPDYSNARKALQALGNQP
ncbi:MAG: tetratricopeptide repeat protein, partial [Sedimentisphaerales bacterium]|nr:tetratricopeptide repeat protein [Sedimentisphaerales bacterium]